MKKKIIIISFIFCLIISVFIIINTKKDKSFIVDGIKYSTKLNGSYVSSFPTKGNYEVTVECENAKGRWNYTKWIAEISNISGYPSCNISFTSTTRTKLNNHIISLEGTTQGTGQVVNENIAISVSERLEKANYTNVGNDSTYPFFWNGNEKTWTSTNHEHSTTADIGFKVSADGSYYICYNQSSEAYSDYATIYVNGTKHTSLSSETSTTTSFSCKSLTLTTNDLITVEYKKNASVSTGNDNVAFYLQKSSNDTVTTNSYRYEGKNPNNYIYFNNELWRIIGVFDSTTHGIKNENLIKIIRNDSLGWYSWNKESVNDWPNSSLYSILNDYYNAVNGTENDYCYQYAGDIKGNCDFRNSGIQIPFRNMIQEVKWYLNGPSFYNKNSQEFLSGERCTSCSIVGRWGTITSPIGLMYMSDYGYSMLESNVSRSSNLETTRIIAVYTWIARYGNEWTITIRSIDTDYVFDIEHNDGNVLNGMNPILTKAVRPTVYLKSDVKYISGTGSQSDPYVIDF